MRRNWKAKLATALLALPLLVWLALSLDWSSLSGSSVGGGSLVAGAHSQRTLSLSSSEDRLPAAPKDDEKAKLSSIVQLQPPQSQGDHSHPQGVARGSPKIKEAKKSKPAPSQASSPKSRSKSKAKKQSALMALKKRFPRIMIVGFGKTGTKALFEVLKMHPKLHGPTQEKRFFSDHYNKGLLYYLKSLPEPSPGGYVVEKSPDYILDDPVALRILASLKSLKIGTSELRFVVMLRDPIDRAMSEYLEWNINRKNGGHEALPPFHVMAVHAENQTVNSKQPFIRASNYAKYISRWLGYFSRNQTCFVDGDLFVQDPFSVVHELESCLRLRPFFSSENFVYESKRGFYCFKSSKNQTAPYCMNGSKGRKHPDISSGVLTSLKNYFRPLDAKLLPLIGREMQWQRSEQQT